MCHTGRCPKGRSNDYLRWQINRSVNCTSNVTGYKFKVGYDQEAQLMRRMLFLFKMFKFWLAQLILIWQLSVDRFQVSIKMMLDVWLGFQPNLLTVLNSNLSISLSTPITSSFFYISIIQLLLGLPVHICVVGKYNHMLLNNDKTVKVWEDKLHF